MELIIRLFGRLFGRCFVWSVLFWAISVQSVLSQKIVEPTTTKRYQEFVEELIKQVDTNRDGVVDHLEQEKNFRPVFEHADHDGNGLITRQEILDAVGGIGARDTGPAVDEAKEMVAHVSGLDSRKLNVFVLKLPNSMRQNEGLGIKEIMESVVASQKSGDPDDEGALILDRIETEVFDRRKIQIGVAGEKVHLLSRKNSNSEQVWQHKTVPFGSQFIFEPRIYRDRVELGVKIEGNYVIKENILPTVGNHMKLREKGRTPVSIELDTFMQFTNKKTNVISVFASDHHFLVICSVTKP